MRGAGSQPVPWEEERKKTEVSFGLFFIFIFILQVTCSAGICRGWQRAEDKQLGLRRSQVHLSPQFPHLEGLEAFGAEGTCGD